MIATVLVVGGATFCSAYYFLLKGFDEQAENGVGLTAIAVQKTIEDAQERVRQDALSFSTRPDVAEAIEKRDEKRLQEISKALMTDNGLDVVTVADSKGNVVARGHSKKTGDSVANQLNVRKALAGEVSGGIEEGTVVKFSIRAGAPVKKDGRIIGTITPGIDLTATNTFVDNMKQRFNVECTIFKSNERVSTTLEENGKRLVGTSMEDPEIIETVLRNGRKLLKKASMAGTAYNTAYWPLTGADGKIVGMLFIGSSRAIVERTSLAVITAVLASVLIVGLLMILIGYLLARSFVKPILNTMDRLKGIAREVSTAAGSLSSSSQQLAEGASEQAASIEETSSSLEELASMTKQNADHAIQANRLMTGTEESVSRASNSMERLTASMGEITRASDETSKIIKTIDEIAFQTNLLALNAAVEAARAGEAGAGFAVVADEVRNLAMRASEAAKNTASLIDGTVKRVKEGSELVAITDGEFREVAGSVSKSSDLVGEISAASKEQAQGIEQVNRAVGEMDKVVQQNAANAEESASASEEMNAQAEHLQQFVVDLLGLFGGKRDRQGLHAERNPEPSGPRKILTRAPEKPATALASRTARTNGRANGKEHPLFSEKASQERHLSRPDKDTSLF